MQEKTGSVYWESFGCIKYFWNKAGLTKISFCKKRGHGSDHHKELENFLSDYLNGCWSRRQFTLNFTKGTVFQQQVWHVLSSIPFGEVRSYQWIADQMGHPEVVRAVGQAVGANPFPIVVPCHRVVNNDGSLGGFSGGLEWKKKLLKMEGLDLSSKL